MRYHSHELFVFILLIDCSFTFPVSQYVIEICRFYHPYIISLHKTGDAEHEEHVDASFIAPSLQVICVCIALNHRYISEGFRCHVLCRHS